MIGRSFPIARLFGIPIKIDLSWLFVVFLLTATLAVAFSRDYPYLGSFALIGMGLAASLLLFLSVLAHEMSHALVALRHRIPIRGITLFVFGGAAEMVEEPPDAAAELRVALAGPAMSLALAIGFAGLYSVGLGWFPAPLAGVVQYLALMNGLLAAFNLVPGFPLDGGRVLRALLWGIWGRLRPATRAASAVGSGFGALLVLVGLVFVFPFGNLLGGLWYVFIGLFLRAAARTSYHQLLLREVLKGIKARDVMSPQVVSVSDQSTIQEAVERVALTTGLTTLPVVDASDQFIGLVELSDIRAVDRASWPFTRVAEIVRPDTIAAAVSPDEEASRLLSMVEKEDALIPVVEGRALIGTIDQSELMRRLRWRLELLER